jgi:DNA-binding NarL/FixJ family response regulator
LIVEESTGLTRQMKKAILDAYPDRVVTSARSAEEALVESVFYPVSLLITSIDLPGMDGIELIQKLCARRPDARALLIVNENDTRGSSRASAGQVCLKRPFEMSDLLEKVAHMFNQAAGPVGAMVAPQAGDASSASTKQLKVSGDSSGKPVESAGAGETPADLQEALRLLRKQVGAMAVCLVGAHGQVIAVEGEQMTPAVQTWAAALPSVFTGWRGVSDPMRAEGQPSFHYQRSLVYDLLCVPMVPGSAAPAGGGWLVLCLRPMSPPLRLLLCFEEVIKHNARILLLAGNAVKTTDAPEPRTGKELENAVSPAEPQAQAAPDDPRLPELASLLDRAAIPQDPAQIDAFWETAETPSTQIDPDSKTVSFEKAQSLGVAPQKLPSESSAESAGEALPDDDNDPDEIGA